FLDEELVRAWLRRRQENAIGLVVQARLRGVIRSEDPDERVELVVIGLDVVVGDRPVVAAPVEGLVLKVVRPESQRDPSPVIRPAAEPPGAKPSPRATADAVRLAVDVPAADAAVERAERLLVAAPPARRRAVVPGEHRAILRRVPQGPRF